LQVFIIFKCNITYFSLSRFDQLLTMKIIYLIVFFCTYWMCSFAQAVSENIRVEKDLVYKEINGWQGKLDFYIAVSKEKKPLIVYIHGGGWIHGKKEAEYDKFSVFLKNGFGVANIEYRLAGQAPAPAAIEDVYCALQYLVSHADQFGIDKKKIIIMGGSAGAHLALMLGLQSPAPVFTGNCSKEKISIAGIISKYGPTDLLHWDSVSKPGGIFAAWAGSRQQDTTFLKSLSPINYVYSKKIPVLFIHGDKDKTVPVEQSIALYDKLKKNGNAVELYIVKDGGHGNFGNVQTPLMDEKMIAFVVKCVNGSKFKP